MGHHQAGKNVRLNTQFWMETEVSVSYIYIYYMWLRRAEQLSLTVLKVRLRKVNKNYDNS